MSEYFPKGRHLRSLRAKMQIVRDEAARACPSQNEKRKFIVRSLSLVVGSMLVLWCLYVLRLYAVQMGQVMEQVSQSTRGQASRNYDAQYGSVADKNDEGMDQVIVRDEITSIDVPVTLRLSQIRQSRVTRKVSNQDDFRHVNQCPVHLEDVQTTLVTQLGADRSWLAKEICARWVDPIVMLVYFESEQVFDSNSPSLRHELEAACSQARFLFLVNDENDDNRNHPVNLLRNVALESARTSHVLLIDGNVLPSLELSREIQSALELRQEVRVRLNVSEKDHDALVVPTFQIDFSEASKQEKFLEETDDMVHLVPRKFEALQECVNSTLCSVFHERDQPLRHSSTRSRRWLEKDWYEELTDPSGEKIQNIKQVPCTASYHYEPYMVLPWCPTGSVEPKPSRIAPLYDERFADYGNDKVQYIEHIRHSMYAFMIVPEGFLFQAPYATPGDGITAPLRSGSLEAFEQFREEIHQKYGQRLKLRRCNAQQLAELKQEQAEVRRWMPPSKQPENQAWDEQGEKVTELVKPFEFFNTSSSELVVLRLSELQNHRTERQFSNQDDYRHVTSCPSNGTEDDIKTTLVTHLDFKRKWLVKRICDRWNGPLVVVLYFSKESDYNNQGTLFRESTEEDCASTDLLYVINDLGEGTLYPINLLRNLAMEGARTSHLLLTDGDFLPSENLAEEINASLQVRKEAREQLNIPEDNRDALVVPAFQIEPKDESDLDGLVKRPRSMQNLIPRNFEELLKCMNSTDCSVFQETIWPHSHSSTRTHRWVQKDWYEEVANASTGASIKNLKHLPCMDNPYYEPYVVVPWCRSGQAKSERLSPLYDERFVGYGKNKCQYIEHIRHATYDFMVVPKGFLIHTPHSFSTERVAWEANQASVRSDNKALWKRFKEEVYNSPGRTKFRVCNVEQRAELAQELAEANQTSDGLATSADKAVIVVEAQKKIQLLNSASLKGTLRMTEIQETRTVRTFWNQDDFRNDTSCPVDFRVDEIRTTLVTQLSSQRFWLVEEICARWKGPIFTVVYFPDETSYADNGASFLEDLQTRCPQLELLFVVNDAGEDTLYPINLLRNLALGGVRTSHVLMHDADFLPSKNLEMDISSAMQIRNKARLELGISTEDRDAIVVPAFQFEFDDKSEQETFLQNPAEKLHMIPRDFEALRECINSTTCLVFHEKHFPQGHSSTRTHLWLQKEWYNDGGILNGNPVRDLNHVRCLDSDFYEPYFVLPWCGRGRERLSPLYDERFVGYGMNKNQYFEHVRHFPHDFLIVPRGFLIHAPHSFSAERLAWDRNTDWLRRENKQKFKEIVNDIHTHYDTKSVKLKSCESLEKVG